MIKRNQSYLATARLKLRGSVVTVEVTRPNGDTYILEWDYLHNDLIEKKGSKRSSSHESNTDKVDLNDSTESEE